MFPDGCRDLADINYVHIVHSSDEGHIILKLDIFYIANCYFPCKFLEDVLKADAGECIICFDDMITGI